MLFSFRSFFIGLIVACIVGCDYHTDEVYFKDVPQPDWSDVSLELTEDMPDTLYLYTRTSLGLQAILGDHKLLNIEARLGAGTILSGTTLVPVVIDADRLASGTYDLVIQVSVSGGTGSLADMAGEERKEISLKYVVVIDNGQPAAPDFFKVEKENGQIGISWKPYKKFNFQYYRLTKYCYYDYGGYYEICWTRDLTDKELMSFTDSSYVGGKAKYEFMIGAANKISVATTQEINIPYDPSLSWKLIDSKTMEVKWRRPPLENNLGEYRISFYDDADTRVFTVTNVNDTVLTMDPLLPFPDTKTLSVVATGKMKDNYAFGERVSTAYVFAGAAFPLTQFLSPITYNKSLDKYFAIGYDKGGNSILTKINASTNEVEQSAPANMGYFGISDNGQYLHVLNDDQIVRLDPVTFDVIDAIPLAEPPDWFGEPKLRVSNTNRLMWGRKVIDMNTKTVIQTFTAVLIAISDDGNYIFDTTSKLYHYTGSSFTQVTINNPGPWGDFTKDNKLVTYGSGRIAVYDPATSAPVNVIESPAMWCSIDPATGLIGGFTDDFYQGPKKFYVYSVSGSQPEVEIDLANISTQYSWITLANNKLIWTDGLIVPVDWYK